MSTLAESQLKIQILVMHPFKRNQSSRHLGTHAGLVEFNTCYLCSYLQVLSVLHLSLSRLLGSEVLKNQVRG